MRSPLPDGERLLDLLAAEATEGIDHGAQRELDAAMAAHPPASRDSLAQAASVLHLALLSGDAEPMPAGLRERLRADAQRFVASPGGSGVTSLPQRLPARPAPWASRLLAAAAVVLALAGWYRVLELSRNATEPSGPSDSPIAQRLALFEAQAADLTRAAWRSDAPGYQQVGGEVLWSDARQAGFMVLRGLPPNDPAQQQYQLWIVDPQRDRHPVDGGVFDVTSAGETIIPIDAKLAVQRPAVFALTLEKPGGVVVSAGPLLVTAAVGG